MAFSGLPDPALAWLTRGLTLAALVAFIAFLFTTAWPLLLVAVASGVVAYLLVREDVRRHPVGPPPDSADEETETEYVPFHAAGIQFTWERRSRKRERKE